MAKQTDVLSVSIARYLRENPHRSPPHAYLEWEITKEDEKEAREINQNARVIEYLEKWWQGNG